LPNRRAIVRALCLFGVFLACGAAAKTTVRGKVCTVFRDDANADYTFLSIDCGGKTVYAYCRDVGSAGMRVEHFRPFVGCEVLATGEMIAIEGDHLRQHLRQMLWLCSTNGLVVASRPQHGPFDVPGVEEQPPSLAEIDTCGPRKIRGNVIARWRGDTFLMKTPAGSAHKVRLREDTALPQLGRTVEAVGKVTTDLYRYGLEQARWREVAQLPQGAEAPPQELSLSYLFTFKGGDRAYFVRTVLHGKTIRVRGQLKSILKDESGANRLLLEERGFQIIVDCSSVPGLVDGLREGCELQVTGVCVMESENWHSDMVFPKVSGLFLVPCVRDDVCVLRWPPWWTPARLLAVIVILLVGLGGILVWNASLRILVARKSRALLREQAMKLKETLKIGERTRLAAELHDFHSQNLTAISYQLAAARSAIADEPAEAGQRLATAMRMLKSCRTDLWRCLWDLRNDALDEPDFAKAIALTVAPVIGPACLAVRFAGRRSEISDSTAHAILSVLRELAANGVNHGHAENIRIAGECRPQVLRFSVSDDGCGFDPAARLGQDEGHFGLDGIRERMARLGGTLDIESSPGHGTYVRLGISRPIPQTSP